MPAGAMTSWSCPLIFRYVRHHNANVRRDSAVFRERRRFVLRETLVFTRRHRDTEGDGGGMKVGHAAFILHPSSFILPPFPSSPSMRSAPSATRRARQRNGSASACRI